MKQEPDLFGSLLIVRQEAARRGLVVEESIGDGDSRLIGMIGGLLAGLNAALEQAAEAGIDVFVAAQYQDQAPPARKRCILTGRMKRLAFDLRI